MKGNKHTHKHTHTITTERSLQLISEECSNTYHSWTQVLKRQNILTVIFLKTLNVVNMRFCSPRPRFPEIC